MSTDRALRYAAGAAVLAVASGAAGWVVFRPAAEGLGWGALGWGLMAAIGVGTGAWLASAYGTRGTGFLKPIVAGILCRLAATLGGALAAAAAGQGALRGFLAGLGVGFAPLVLYETVFFYRAGRPRERDRAESES